MKYAVSSLIVCSAISLPLLASAQELGDKGNMVFSADRLMGITGSRWQIEEGGVEADNDFTSFSFGWRYAPTPFDVPRVAFDYMVIDRLSVGGALGFFSTDPDEGGDVSRFLFSPRVGYAYAFGRVVGIWPRGGFTYHSGELGGTDENGFALTLECPFTFAPTEHFAFHVGPTFDIDMFGEVERSVGGGVTLNADQNYRSIGLNAGLLGYF